MELNDFTLNVLKNFSDIQPNILINSCSKEIKTLSESRNIMARAVLSQEIPDEVRIYDLKEFLSVLRLMETPTLSFSNDYLTIADSSGRSRIKYFFADNNTLTVAQKDIVMPESEVEFEMDDKTLGSLRSASAALGHETFTVTNVDGVIRLTVEDIEDDTSNKYSIDVPGQSKSEDFRFIFYIDYVKVIPGDYTVKLSSKLISEFKNKKEDLVYWIALHKSSEYTV